MRAARAVLVAVGVLGLGAGAWLLVTTNRPSGLLDLLVWGVAAVVLHDAVLSPVVFVLGWLLRRAGRRIPIAALAVVQAAAVVGGIGSLLLLPAIRAKTMARNPSVLPLDYGASLAGMWVVLGAASAVGIAIVLIAQRRRDRAVRP